MSFILRYIKPAAVATAVLSASLASPSASAQDIPEYLQYQPTQTDVGGAGLLQMPSARMARQGEFTVFYYDNDEYRRIGLSLQLFPWLETIIRYNDVRTRLYNPIPEFSGDQTYKDRGVDVKFRLWEESQYIPQISLGLRDFAGTGQFSGEYLVASKRWHDFDFTLGMGWGYLGRSGNIDNPFCEITDSYCERPGGFQGEGGSFEYDEWFKGNAALYGGVEWQSPWAPLSVKVEYDGNDYSDESSRTAIIQDSHWNLGLHYRLHEHANIQVSFERGNTLMFGFNLRTNFNDAEQYKQRPRKRTAEDLDNTRRPVHPEQLNTEQLVNQVYRETGWANSKLTLSDDGKTLTSYGYQTRYRDRDEGDERTARLLATKLPESITEYQLIDAPYGLKMQQTQIDASQVKAAMRADSIDAQAQFIRSDVESTDPQGRVLAERDTDWNLPSFSVRPYIQQSFGSPENFYMYELRADAYSTWEIKQNVFVDGRAALRLAGNYDDFNFIIQNDDSPLPRVRTYIRSYVEFSDIWLENLQATYLKQINKDWYASVYGGYFERMFGGVGSEILYRPYGQGWGVGMDINWAKQRAFDSHFGFRDYDVLTGHVSGYWKPSFLPDSMIRVAAGRFLAKDVGVQVNFEHKFDSGVIVGAYAAKTDVSAEDYGEGSFTKGFYLSLPFDLFQMRDSKGRATVGWTPLTRDGGQMLMRQRPLFGVTDARDAFYSN
ncbi:MAG: polysaccharide biosynthesis protein [Idiomarina sp.]|uniref:YjbH domain-containing protein n=1 Tax=Idiomarina sp. TaxID=1874361 RepID=UPI000C553CB0|nr:YjbH domain-containing protein [Idiomarina sp.]MBT42214.1 polysaccharide biosynthesis protein [Idiomarina sp.]